MNIIMNATVFLPVMVVTKSIEAQKFFSGFWNPRISMNLSMSWRMTEQGEIPEQPCSKLSLVKVVKYAK